MEYCFAENLKKFRKKRGYTQYELAKKIGMSQNILCEWENNTRYPSIDKVYDLAKALEIRVEFLLKCPESSIDRTKN